MELKIYNQSGALKLTASTSSSSTWNRELMTENAVSASFTHTVYVPLDVNDYILLEGVKFSIKKEYKPKQKNRQTYSYSVKFYAPIHDAEQVMYLNLTDGQYEPQFSLDGSPREHLQKWVENMNRVYGEERWHIGDVIDAPNKTIEYGNTYCRDALGKIAEAFGTEWWEDGFYINLCRCERGERVSLGYLQGLTSLTQTENTDDVKFFTRLIPLGSTKNIDRSRYGFSRLQLPNRAKYIDRNTQYGLYEHVEADAFAGIFPHYTGTVAEVRTEEKTGEDKKPFTVYYFKDAGMAFNPCDNEIAGLVKHVSFQTGDLVGRDFEANYHPDTKEWEIINTYPNEDTQIPGGNLIPRTGDTYIPWNFRMPKAYEKQAELDYKVAVDDFLAKYSEDIAKYGGDTDYTYIIRNGIPLLPGQSVRLLSEEYFPSTGYRDTRMTKVVRKLDNLSIATIECTNQVGKGWRKQVNDSLNSLQYVVGETLNQAVIDVLKTWDKREPNEYNVFSAPRTLKEIAGRAISKLEPDETKFLVKFLSGLYVENGLAADTVEVEKATTLNLLVRSVADIYDVSVSHVATLMGTIIKDYISSETFVSGIAGEGIKISRALNGDWNMELDNLTVRKVFSVFVLAIQKIIHQGGMVIRSVAGAKLTKVSDGGTYWRCEHDSTDDFVQGDQIICQSFTGAAAKRYWRLVTSAGSGYFNLSKTDCEPGSAIPEAGDEVAVLGNRTDRIRQAAQIDCSVGDSAPYRDDYAGINSYTLAGRLISRTGNLNGITDAVAGVLSGAGMYSTNVCLRGAFILKSGKKVEDAISDVENNLDKRITTVETDFEIREGQISSRVTEATTAATNAKNSATTAANHASTAVNSAASAANNAASAGTNASVAAAQAELAMAMSKGKMLYRDPSFRVGLNGCSVYNNTGNSNVTVARVAGVEGNPNSSGYCLKITTTGTASPGFGGFVQAPTVQANQCLVYRIIANIPKGRTLNFARNTAGNGASEKWLTANAGTGNWEEYAYKLRCGTSGGFSTCGHFYLSGGSTPTASTPLAWYVAYATVFDTTDAEIDYIADAAGKYTTKTEHSSSIKQLSDRIELKVSTVDFTALGNRVKNAETTISQHTNQIALKAAQTDVAELGARMNSAEAKITPDAIKLTVETQTKTIVSTAITSSQNDIRSSLTIDTGGISLLGKKISFTGMVTFSALATDAQDAITGKATPEQVEKARNDAVQDAEGKIGTLRNSLKSLAYLDAVGVAKLDSTIITGGYLKTSLIQAGSLTAREINVSSLFSQKITTGNIEITKGARVGGFEVSDGRIGIDYNGSASGMALYSSYIGFKAGSARTARLGTDVLPASTGISAMCLIQNNENSPYGNIGMLIDVTNKYSSSIPSFNTAINLVGGGIAGFGLKPLRTAGTTYLNASDVFVTCVNTSSINIYLPSSPPTGRVIFVKKNGSGNVTVNGNGKKIESNYSYSSVSYSTTGKIGFFIFDGVAWQVADLQL